MRKRGEARAADTGRRPREEVIAMLYRRLGMGDALSGREAGVSLKSEGEDHLRKHLYRYRRIPVISPQM